MGAPFFSVTAHCAIGKEVVLQSGGSVFRAGSLGVRWEASHSAFSILRGSEFIFSGVVAFGTSTLNASYLEARLVTTPADRQER